ncbi:MAG: tetratricopeptide repeat protein [Candidatus Latescibacterota bacterium]|nr:tetratricopeptide repeat protein [Candidatus Latescibacterota bacterium]
MGLALVSIANSEFKSANNFIVLAKRQDRRCVQAYIAEGRLIVKRGLKLNLAPDLWIDDSLKSFHQALEINNENSEALYYMGNAYLSSGNLEDSQNTFKIILNSNDQHWTKRARKRLKFVQEIVRLAPGSLMGKQIGFKETVTRAEMAVLLVEELKITEILPRTKVSSVINNKIMSAEHQNYSIDSQHWASGWVDMILELGVPGLGLFPDGNFYHEDRLTRVQCSLIISFLMEHLSANKVGFQKYIGTKSTFPDLKSNHYAYAAASLAVDLGLLQLEDIRTGNFDPFGTISGIEALNIIRRLQDSFRMEF